jgi:hypothetical protein
MPVTESAPGSTSSAKSRRRTIALSVVVIVVLLVGSFVAYYYFEVASTTTGPSTVSSLLVEGDNAYYGYGGSVLFNFNTTSARSVLSGGFATNTSLTLYLMSSSDYNVDYVQNHGSRPFVTWYYSTLDVRSANISIPLYQGAWYLLFEFDNDTGRLVNTANGSSMISTTQLEITKTFTVSPEGPEIANNVYPYGADFVNLKGTRGSNVTGQLAVNMSGPGALAFFIDSESMVVGTGNSSSSSPVGTIVPWDVSIGASTYIFLLLPGEKWNGSQAVPAQNATFEGPSTIPTGFVNGVWPKVMVFGVELNIPPTAAPGHYLLTLTVVAFPIDLPNPLPMGMATFSIDLTVS